MVMMIIVYCLCSSLEDCVSGNCLSFCKSILTLLMWLLNIIVKSTEHQVTSAATDKALGLPVPSVDGVFSYGSLIDRACDCIDKLTSSKTMSALVYVAAADDAGLWMVFDSFTVLLVSASRSSSVLSVS